MAMQSESGARIVDAALDLAAQRGWRRTSLADIAAAADMELAELYRIAPSKASILAAFATRIDEAMLADPDPKLADEPIRDRLFALVMRRFDAMQPYREAVCALAAPGAADPIELACGGPAPGALHGLGPRGGGHWPPWSVRLPSGQGPGRDISADAQGLDRRRQRRHGKNHGESGPSPEARR